MSINKIPKGLLWVIMPISAIATFIFSPILLTAIVMLFRMFTGDFFLYIKYIRLADWSALLNMLTPNLIEIILINGFAGFLTIFIPTYISPKYKRNIGLILCLFFATLKGIFIALGFYNQEFEVALAWALKSVVEIVGMGMGLLYVLNEYKVENQSI